MTEEERLKAHLGDALGEAVFEKACQLWADRVPWDRALAQAEDQNVPGKAPSASNAGVQGPGPST